jgi:hypothetical protein
MALQRQKGFQATGEIDSDTLAALGGKGGAGPQGNIGGDGPRRARSAAGRKLAVGKSTVGKPADGDAAAQLRHGTAFDHRSRQRRAEPKSQWLVASEYERFSIAGEPAIIGD